MTSLYNNFIDYLKGSYQELNRVIWPSSKTTTRLTLVVIGISLFVAIILGIFDGAFSYAVQYILAHTKSVVP